MKQLRLLSVLITCALPFSLTLLPVHGDVSVRGDQVVHAARPAIPHPHFPKTLICELSKSTSITLKHLTVTFDKKGAAKMALGKSWHLAGATFETTADLVVGGHKVLAGSYALSARKSKDGWQLVLHKGKGFSRPGEDALALKTIFEPTSLLYEHLNCDIQPSGDKEHTKLFLDVRFDTMLARTSIELPE